MRDFPEPGTYPQDAWLLQGAFPELVSGQSDAFLLLVSYIPSPVADGYFGICSGTVLAGRLPDSGDAGLYLPAISAQPFTEADAR